MTHVNPACITLMDIFIRVYWFYWSQIDLIQSLTDSINSREDWGLEFQTESGCLTL